MSDLNKLLLDAARFTPDASAEFSAWLGHLPFAGFIVAALAPRVIVELGSHRGHSYFAFCKSVRENRIDARCYAVDTWQGDEHAGHYGDEIHASVHAHNQEHYAHFSTLLRMTFDEALNYFADGSVELLHIDGLHTYEAVRHDFETWLPKLAPGAVVLFHDTNVREREFGVWKLWEELSARYPANLNFKHSHGLGVLQLPGATDRRLDWLLAEPAFKAEFMEYFAALGRGEQQRYELLSARRVMHDQAAVLKDQGAAIDGVNRTLGKAYDDIGQLQQEKQRIEQALAESQNTIDQLVNSTSWKLTRPVRMLGNRLSRLRRLAATARLGVQMAGGLLPACRKVQQILRTEGASGLLTAYRRIHHKSRAGHIQLHDYAGWVRTHDTLSAEQLLQMRELAAGMQHRPLISVVVPVYNANVEWLRLAIESVRQQAYDNWELCIADDASSNPAVREFLEHAQAGDSRIKVVFRAQNGHISACSNSALELAAGEWVALLDQDDLLAADALFWVANTINEHPECQMIYSDEDKINEQGERYSAYFKSDWNLFLFRSQNMFSHLGVYKRSLLDEVGGFRKGYEGAQDHDLALRCSERIEAAQIVHIPRVLYHWRVHEKSTAGGLEAKPYAAIAGERAIGEHLARLGIDARVERVRYGYRVHYALPATLPRVSIIIPTRNGLELVRTCIESILKETTYGNYEILLIDNGSDDPACLEYFRKLEDRHENIRVIRDERPFNYSALNNAAVAQASGSIIALVNNDIEVIAPEWLSEMVSIVLQPGVGAVGAKLLYPDETVQHAGVVIGLGGVAGHVYTRCSADDPGYFGRIALTGEYAAVTAACLVVKKADFEAVNGLNETDLAIAFNDVDFCLKLKKAGLHNVYTPYALLFHHESATRGSEDNPEKVARFNREVDYMLHTWPDYIARDPFYNPNLSLNVSDFALAWPPRLTSAAAAAQAEIEQDA